VPDLVEKLLTAWILFGATKLDTGNLGGLGGTFWSTLIGAVVGAVVGGFISYLLQRQSAHEARQERLDAKRQENIATAFSTMVKVIKMLSSIAGIRFEVISASRRNSEMGMDNNGLWQNMPPYGTFPAPVEFDSREGAFILSTKDNDLMLKTLELADVYNDLVGLIRLYSERRVSLTSLFLIEEVQENHAISPFDQTQLQNMMPSIIGLRFLTEALTSRSEKDYQQARDVFDRLKNRCKEMFGKDFPPIEVESDHPNIGAPPKVP